MFSKSVALLHLLIFNFVLAEEISNCCGSEESKIIAANIYDDNVLKDIQGQLELLKTSNENLRLKLDSVNMNLEQKFSQQREEFKNELRAAKESHRTAKSRQDDCDESYADLIDIRGDFVFEKSNSNPCTKTKKAPQTLPENCAEAMQQNDGKNGIYRIKIPDSKLEPFYVHCIANVVIANDHSNNTAPWLMIQRRQDGSIDFHQNWADYQNGIGNLEGEFFLGLDKLHALTNTRLHELWIQLEDSDGINRWAKYKTFAIGGPKESYALNILGTYTGNAGDSLAMHAGLKWTTKDVDNDSHGENCANLFVGAWWYKACHHSNLNGKYGDNTFGKGINWYAWHGHTYSIKYVHMAIRPKQ